MSNIKFYECHMVAKNDEYSICILATHKPTIQEVEEFLTFDMLRLQMDNVDEVLEISKDEAFNFFDMTNVSQFPILA